MTIISKEAVLCKAEEEAKGMSEPYNYEFAPLVHWILDKIPSVEPEPNWIPIKMRPMTDEEKDMYGYGDSIDNGMIYCCDLPDDEQDVLITTKWKTVEKTRFHNEYPEGCYFEDYEDFDDVIAWMPSPKRYEEEKNEVSN